MWYAVRARAGAEVLAGLKPGVTREIFKRAIADGTAEDCLAARSAARGRRGLRPGRHRAHDRRRPGPLRDSAALRPHLSRLRLQPPRRAGQARASCTSTKRSRSCASASRRGGKIEPVRDRARRASRKRYFVACRYFATEKWEFAERIAAATSPRAFRSADFPRRPRHAFDGARESRRIRVRRKPGCIPAALGAYQLAPASATSLLRTYVPGPRRIRAQTRRLKASAKRHWSRVVHPMKKRP